jgi:tetratricopeptide (TPR) repeat protein
MVPDYRARHALLEQQTHSCPSCDVVIKCKGLMPNTHTHKFTCYKCEKQFAANEWLSHVHTSHSHKGLGLYLEGKMMHWAYREWSRLMFQYLQLLDNKSLDATLVGGNLVQVYQAEKSVAQAAEYLGQLIIPHIPECYDEDQDGALFLPDDIDVGWDHWLAREFRKDNQIDRALCYYAMAFNENEDIDLALETMEYVLENVAKKTIHMPDNMYQYVTYMRLILLNDNAFMEEYDGKENIRIIMARSAFCLARVLSLDKELGSPYEELEWGVRALQLGEENAKTFLSSVLHQTDEDAGNKNCEV